MAGGVFINYRRGDDPGNTGRLFDRLQEAFRADQLFMDVASIAPGVDFVRKLEEQIEKCDVLLAVIGKGWINARDARGARRLDSPQDFVRIEIETALILDKLVIPVLVGEAQMPQPGELPETIRPLATRNAVRLTHERFRTDAEDLVKALEQALDQIEATRWAKAEEERRRHEEAANARARVQREREERTRREKLEARQTSNHEGKKRLIPSPVWPIGGGVIGVGALVALVWNLVAVPHQTPIQTTPREPRPPAIKTPQPSPIEADASDYPVRPIQLVVGFAAGGGNDLFARLVGQKLSENIGQPVIVENKVGAGGRLAIDYVKQQPADGYTLMIAASGQMAIAAAIYPNLSYHPTRDFVPVTMIASFPLFLASASNSTIKTVKELVAYGKANPGKSNYATSSPAFTITTELFKLKTRMPAVAVPYKSSNEMMLSVAGGNALFAIADGPPAVPLVQGGKIRALAVTGWDRSAELPDVPSMGEVGYPDIDMALWSGVFVLANTSPSIVRRLDVEIRRSMSDPGVRDKLKKMGVSPGGMRSEEFRARIDSDIKLFADVVKGANLKFEE